VAGLGYKCGTSAALSGTTDSNGYYTCKEGESVGFYVGDILIGSVASAQTVVTPLDLVGAGAKPTDVAVSNIVRFLLSISTTNGAGNLVIDANAGSNAMGQTVDFKTIGATALDSMIRTVKPGATIATQSAAENHMRDSIYKLFAKSYSGTYSGSGSGTWSIVISASDGSASGTYTDTVNGDGTITGQMSTDLSTDISKKSTYGFTGSAGSNTWTGALNVGTGVFSGTWNGGAFTGKPTTASTSSGGITTCASSHYSVAVHAPSASELATYVKTYTGNVGNFGQNIGDPFVSTGSASFVFSSSGGLTYNGATKAVTSMCLEDTPTAGAPLYLEMGASDHIDLFTDAGFTGVISNGASFDVVRGGSCTTTCGSGGTTTPTITNFTPTTGAIGTTVSITGTNLGRFTPAPLVKFGTTNAGGPYTNVTDSNVTFTVPTGLAAGAHTITISNFDGSNSVTVGTFTVTAASVASPATGMTVAPAANGLTSFPNAVPRVSLVGSDRTFTYKKASTTDDGFDYFDIGYAVVSGETYLSIDLRVGNAITINGSPATSFVSHTLFCTLIAAPTPSGTALCSTKGIVFDQTAGSVTMTNTPLTRSVVVNGSFSFTPF
jgi:hypothetical protein